MAKKMFPTTVSARDETSLMVGILYTLGIKFILGDLVCHYVARWKVCVVWSIRVVNGHEARLTFMPEI